MEGCFGKALLWMGVLSAWGTSSLPHQLLTYDEAVGLAVAVYNKKAGEDCIYRLLEARAEPRWDPVSESHPELNFTIKETGCLLQDAVLFEECDFKEDGDQPRRVKRFLRVFKKLKKGMEKLFQRKKLVPGSVTS